MSATLTPPRPRPSTTPATPATAPVAAPTAPPALGPHPPRARLALNVGILASDAGEAGGDASLLPEAAATRLRDVLDDAMTSARAVLAATPDAFATGEPVLRVVTSLTTRHERAAATLAVEQGFALQVVLPCPRETLRALLPAPEQAVLTTLLAAADAILELDGTLDRSTAAREAGEAMADVLLDQSDLLIILGDAAGGTSQRVWYAIREAAARELTRVTIADTAGAALEIIVSDRVGTPVPVDRAGLRDHLASLLSPPRPAATPDDPAGADPLHDYFAEQLPRHAWLAWTWNLFVGLIAESRVRRPRLRSTVAANSASEWDAVWTARPALPAPLIGWLNHTLRTAYIWPDALSVHYGGAFRGSFVVTTLLSTATVLVVLLAYVVGSPSTGIDNLNHIASIGFVFAILAVTWLTNRRRWHERWLDYRMLAELLRQLRFLAPMGRVPKFARLPAHDAADDPRGTWMAWQAHTVARDLGLVTARVDQPYRDAYLAYLRDGLISGIAPDTGQLGYHESVASRFARLELRAGDLKVGLMWAAVAVSFIQLGDSWLWATWDLPGWFSALIAVFAGLGGAIASVAGQADAGRVKKRSRAMRDRLEHIRETLARPEAAVSAAVLGEVADATADAMLAELTDYRLVFQGKPLRYPG